MSGGNITRVFPGHPMTKTLSFPEFLLQGALVRSLIRELRSHMPCNTAREKKKEKEGKHDPIRPVVHRGE